MFCCDTKLSGKANKDMNINYLGELLWLSDLVSERVSKSVQYFANDI